MHGDKPWAVQVEAMKRAEGHDRYGWHLDCGLGKSSLTFNDYINDNDVDLMVVFAPNSFKLDWTQMPAEWGRPDVSSWVHPKAPPPFKEEIGVYAINYEAARSGAFDGLEKLLATRKCMMVIDESTAIFNPQSQISKGVRALAKLATKVRILNGTPMVKSAMDYYSSLRCLGKINGMNPYQFRNRYCVLGGFQGKQVIGVNPEREGELMELLDSCSFRALKKDWRADLPPQIVVDPTRLEMTPKQRRYYGEMLRQFRTMIDSGLEITADMALTQMGKLRQISSCLAMQDGDVRFFEEAKDNPKIQAALDIHESGYGKSLLVCVHVAVVDTLIDICTKRGYNPAFIRGSMKPEDLITQKDRFNNDPDCRTMICQQAAACRGHTLVGGEGNDSCNKTVYVENDFSLYQRLQMNDRNYRGAQAEPCLIYDLVTSPIDEFVIDTLRKKQNMAERMDRLVLAVKSTY